MGNFILPFDPSCVNSVELSEETYSKVLDPNATEFIPVGDNFQTDVNSRNILDILNPNASVFIPSTTDLCKHKCQDQTHHNKSHEKHLDKTPTYVSALSTGYGKPLHIPHEIDAPLLLMKKIRTLHHYFVIQILAKMIIVRKKFK